MTTYTVNGKRVSEAYVEKYHRDRKGRYAKTKFRIRRFFKNVLFYSIIISAIWGVSVLYAQFHPVIEFQSKEVQVDNLNAKILTLKNNVLDQVKLGESKGEKESDAVIQFDPDNSGKAINIPSLGLYRFKITTIIYYEKQLYGKTLTPLDAINIAFNEQEARALASDIIFKENGIDNWHNTSLKYGLVEKVKIIKSLEA